MINEQEKRRNINDLTRSYLIGTRYLEERNDGGRPLGSLFEKKLARCDLINGQNIGSTDCKIAKQSNLGNATVKRAAVFAEALNKIVTNTGIKRNSVL